jgi:purine nucleosidase
MPQKIIFDTDLGIDDACAVLLALASPELSVEGLTMVHGNCALEQAAKNALSILELGHASQIPVARGCDVPLVKASLLAPETHGESGLGYAKLPEPQTQPVVQHAIDFLIQKILAAPGEITLVAIGPLTNLALAIRQEPRVVKAVKELIVMGGAIRHEGNTTALAEFNAYVDPHAAHIIFHAGFPTTLVPLDVTYQCILTPDDVRRIRRVDSPITKFIEDATRFYMEFHDEYQGIQGCVINDPLALALTFAPELCTYQELPVEIDISPGISLGKTIGDFYNYEKKPASMKVALGVDARGFIELFLERIETLARSFEA